MQELQVARDRNDPRHCLPDIAAHERDVLDIGCGIGQLFAVLTRDDGDGLSVGIDIDHAALAYGAAHFPGPQRLRSRSERIPFAAASFDLVVARVSLPYTDLRRSLDEIARVLRPGGRIWMTLHPFARVRGDLVAALRRGQFRDALYRCYVAANGLLWHASGRMLPFATSGRYESFQTASGMRRQLQARGFDAIRIERDRHFIVSARKAPFADP